MSAPVAVLLIIGAPIAIRVIIGWLPSLVASASGRGGGTERGARTAAWFTTLSAAEVATVVAGAAKSVGASPSAPATEGTSTVVFPGGGGALIRVSTRGERRQVQVGPARPSASDEELARLRGAVLAGLRTVGK